MAFKVRRSLEGVQSIINECMKNNEETKDLGALKIALDGSVTLGEMLKQVEELSIVAPIVTGHSAADLINHNWVERNYLNTRR